MSFHTQQQQAASAEQPSPSSSLPPPTEDPQLSQLCPRLLDYLCIVGTRNYEGVNHRHAASVQPPELLRRFPTDDHKVSHAC